MYDAPLPQILTANTALQAAKHTKKEKNIGCTQDPNWKMRKIHFYDLVQALNDEFYGELKI